MDDYPELSDVFRPEAIEAQKHPHIGLASILHTRSPATIAGWWVVLAAVVVWLLFFSHVPMVESFEVTAASQDLVGASPYSYKMEVAANKLSGTIKLPAEVLSTCRVPYVCIHRTNIAFISTGASSAAGNTVKVTIILSEPVQASRIVALVIPNGEVSLADLIRRRINSIGRAK